MHGLRGWRRKNQGSLLSRNGNTERKSSMQNLTRAHHELFRRHPDERFGSLSDLWQHCQNTKQWSTVRWVSPAEFAVEPSDDGLSLQVQGQPMTLTDWSFMQLCSLARVKIGRANV